jgi:hypothetical protein
MTRLSAPLAVLLAATARAADPAVPDDWAFKPVTRPAVPKVGDASPVDAFLLAKLRAAGLGYAPPADRATFVRRATFDLHGLPPTPEEVDAFVRDERKDAYERLIDRLLASPRFGERAAVWWLDLARYAESDGFKADDPRPNAWRYRDYVIRSFNADKPYDRFVREQLAGDELYPGNPDALVATGFLRHFPDEYNAVNLEQRRQEILNDITDTTGAALLGLTVGCAKCHDHKTDPVTQADYYRLQAFFAGYRPTDTPVGVDADHARRQAEWEAKTADLRRQMAELEQPVREKAAKKERMRFQAEHLAILDKPAKDRTPLEEQLAAMVARQVNSARKFSPSQMKPADREKWEGMNRRMAELAKDRPPEPPAAMAMTDVGTVAPATHVLKRGNWQKPGDEVAPGFLSAVDDRDAEVTPTGTSTGRRAALAKWVTDPKVPFTGRVLVNRVWQHLFGRGIVGTASDLGATGERPTHPELLDWLAAEFVADGWSVKRAYRRLLLSEAYRQSARGSESGYKADPENRLLWQMPRKRLDGEGLRDAMLAVAGTLNPKAGGPSVYPELPAELAGNGWKPSADPAERNRRSVYVAVKRNVRYPLFALFDAPDRCETCARRFPTTTAPQALGLLNDATVIGLARQFAARVMTESKGDPDAATDRAFRLALGRPPTSEERAKVAAFLAKRGGLTADTAADLCHAVFNLNEFLYVD